MTTIGFIGLGHMGHPMAHNLLKAGHTLFVYDVMPAAVAVLVKQGAHSVDSIAALAQQSDVIITSVQTGQQVSDLCLGADGLFENAKPGTLYVDCFLLI